MPNTTLNTCKIMGPKEHIAMLLEDMNKNGDMRLSHAYPQPKEFIGIYAGNITIDNEQHNVWRYSTKIKKIEDMKDATPVAIPDAEQDAILLQHGTMDPLEWQYANWGTKWGDYDTVVEKIDDEEFMVAFTSAWKEPDLLLHEIAMKYSVIIQNKYILEFEDETYYSEYPIEEKEVYYLKDLHRQTRKAMKAIQNMVSEQLENNPKYKGIEILKSHGFYDEEE